MLRILIRMTIAICSMLFEDPSDPKGFVKLVIYFVDMCSENQQRVFCYPATKSKGLTK
jgi:hypothetical protein